MDSKIDNTGRGLPLSRRRFIGLGSSLLAAPLLARLPLFAREAPSLPLLPLDRSLAFFNTHTRESLATEYCRDGCLDSAALERIDYILRDDRTGDIKKIDVRLLDLLVRLREKIEAANPYHVISGYRSPKTNEDLRLHGGGGVAANSLHLLGQAIDIRVPGTRLNDLRDAALALKGGGVGFYPSSDFIHVDVGRVRRW